MEVLVFVKEARELDAKDKSGTSDPYCVLQCDGKASGKTKTVKKTLAPSWNEKFALCGTELSIEVMDWNALAHVWMGDLTLELGNPGAAFEEWFPLEPKAEPSKKHDNSRVKGEILLRFEFPQNDALVAAVNANNYEDAGKLLVGRGASTRALDRDAWKGVSEFMIALLLENGFEPGNVEELLMHCVSKGLPKALTAALTYFSFNLPETILETALRECSKEDQSAIVDILLKSGAKVTDECLAKSDCSTAHFARGVLTKLLVAGGNIKKAPKDAIFQLIPTSNLDAAMPALKRYLDEGGDPNVRTSGGGTLLHRPSYYLHIPSLQLLAQHMDLATLNAANADDGDTAMHTILKRALWFSKLHPDHEDRLKVSIQSILSPLLMAGCNPEIRNAENRNCLDLLMEIYGTFVSHQSAMFSLVAHGAKVTEFALNARKRDGFQKSGPPTRYEFLLAVSQPKADPASWFIQQDVSALQGQPDMANFKILISSLDWAAQADCDTSLALALSAAKAPCTLLTSNVTKTVNVISSILRFNAVKCLRVVLDKIPAAKLPELWTELLGCPLAWARAPILKLLLQLPGIDWNAQDPKGESILASHLIGGRFAEVKMLLEAGADPSVLQKETNLSLLHALCYMGHIGVAELLLDHPKFTAIDALDATGESALIKSVEHNRVEITRLLVSKKANLEIGHQCNTKHTALMVALTLKHFACAEILILAGAQVTDASLELACTKQMTSAVRLMLSGDCVKPTGKSMLASAVQGDIATASMLLKFAPRELLDVVDEPMGATPLMLATKAGRFDFVRWIITRGADMNILSKNRSTVRSYAKDWPEIEAFLITRGAKLSGQERKRKAKNIGRQILEVLESMDDDRSFSRNAFVRIEKNYI